jgi:hypothetical protein
MFYDTIKAASIKLLIKKRQKCFADGNRTDYTEIANRVKREIYHRKRVYYRRKISSNRFNPWRLINSHRDQQQRATEDQVLADALNAGSHSVWSDRRQPDISHYKNIAAAPPTSPVFNETNVVAAFDELNTSSPGPDGLSARVLKSARLQLAGTIAHLFNVFILKGFSPEQWRDAYLTSITKVDHPLLWSDYRPISLTSNLCKTFERVLVKHILQLTREMWAHNKQHGFLPGHSTADAVVQVLFEIGRAVDQGHPVLAIFFDFAKAFDLVPHDKLLIKLEKHLPLWLVKWIAAYLSNRRVSC